MGTCETPKIARALPSAAPAVNCGWSVDGTVAVHTKPYEYFIVLYFWHALELRKHDCESDTHQRLTTRAGAHDQYRCRREPITPIPRGTVVISGPRWLVDILKVAAWSWPIRSSRFSAILDKAHAFGAHRLTVLTTSATVRGGAASSIFLEDACVD